MKETYLSTSLPVLCSDVWITILASVGLSCVDRFRDVSKAARAIANDESVWREIWLQSYHSDFYHDDSSETLEDSLDDARWLIGDMTRVSTSSQESRAEFIEQCAPGGVWRSWQDKVRWRASMARCGGGGSGCGRLFRGSPNTWETDNDVEKDDYLYCPSCSHASSLIAVFQGLELASFQTF
jgi:F-box domain